jgi:hypothetical protein
MKCDFRGSVVFHIQWQEKLHRSTAPVSPSQAMLASFPRLTLAVCDTIGIGFRGRRECMTFQVTTLAE